MELRSIVALCDGAGADPLIPRSLEWLREVARSDAGFSSKPIYRLRSLFSPASHNELAPLGVADGAE